MGASTAGWERVVAHVSAGGAGVAEAEHAHLVQQEVPSASLGRLSVYFPVSLALFLSFEFLLIPTPRSSVKVVFKVTFVSPSLLHFLRLILPAISSFLNYDFLTSIQEVHCKHTLNLLPLLHLCSTQFRVLAAALLYMVNMCPLHEALPRYGWAWQAFILDYEQSFRHMGFPALGVALTGLLQAVSATLTFTFLPNSKDPVRRQRQRAFAKIQGVITQVNNKH